MGYVASRHAVLVWDSGYGRPMGLHGGYEVGMGLGTDYHTLTQTHHSPLMGMGKKPVHTVKDSKYCHYIE